MLLSYEFRGTYLGRVFPVYLKRVTLALLLNLAIGIVVTFLILLNFKR